LAKYTLNVNGATREVEAMPDTPLLWVLRDNLDLYGAKYGCGVGICGACSIVVEGSAVRSCMMTVEQVGSKKITTIEGLSKNGDHPLQKAWVEHDVPQCGYCQAGQIMAAAALLQKTPKPTEADIDKALHDNVCRCGTYERIKDAVLAAAKEVK
jgi:isoquinoline 1-oxidoreductase alpha subunit